MHEPTTPRHSGVLRRVAHAHGAKRALNHVLATMIDAVKNGAAGSWQLSNLGPKMLQGDFRPGFKVWHQQKDLRLALELANQSSTPLTGTALVHQLFAALEADGQREAGTQALVKALEKLANTTLAGDS